MPLHQDVEQSQSEADPSLEIVPGFVGHALEVADIGEHGEHGFDDHADIPFPAFAKTQVGGMPIVLRKTGIGKDDHIVAEFVDQVLKRSAIMDIRSVTLPIDDAAQMVKHEA